MKILTYAKNMISGEWSGRAVNTKGPEFSHKVYVYLHDIQSREELWYIE